MMLLVSAANKFPVSSTRTLKVGTEARVKRMRSRAKTRAPTRDFQNEQKPNQTPNHKKKGSRSPLSIQQMKRLHSKLVTQAQCEYVCSHCSHCTAVRSSFWERVSCTHEECVLDNTGPCIAKAVIQTSCKHRTNKG